MIFQRLLVLRSDDCSGKHVKQMIGAVWNSGYDLSDAAEDGMLNEWLRTHLTNAKPTEPVKDTPGFTTVSEALQEARTGKSTQAAAAVEFAATRKDRFLYIGGS